MRRIIRLASVLVVLLAGAAASSRAEPIKIGVIKNFGVYTFEPVEQILPAIPHIDADARLDERDVLHQIAWYKSHGMVKGEVDAAAIMDPRYVLPTTTQR